MPPVTLFLIAANAVIFLLQLAVPGIEAPFALWPLGAAGASGGHVSFQIWQVVTYAFLHGSVLHIGLNMFALYMFGAPMERVFGPRRYLTYYFVCVLSAAIAQLLTSAMTGTL
jgi:membrane associated rhomboid family serine protease